MANELIQMIQQRMNDDDFVEQLSRQIGGAEKQKTAAAASGIASILTGALAKNTQDKQGASALANALDRDHDGSILDDVFGMLSGSGQPANTKMVDGSGILNHLLGNRQSGATQMISKMSGLEKDKTGQLMTMLAPVIMGMLGKTKREQGLDETGLAGLLSGAFARQKTQSNNPAMDMITGFLDQDNDGQIADDVFNIGKKLLGGLFRKKN